MSSTFLVLGACGLTLAFVVGYAFWVKIRTLRFKAEILELYANLRHVAVKRGCLSDPLHISTCKYLGALLAKSEMVSLPVTAYLVAVAMKEPQLRGTDLPASNDAHMETAAKEARDKAASCVMYHITHRTVTGGVFWLTLRFLPKKVAKEEVREAVRASTGVMLRSNSLSHC